MLDQPKTPKHMREVNYRDMPCSRRDCRPIVHSMRDYEVKQPEGRPSTEATEIVVKCATCDRTHLATVQGLVTTWV